MIYELTQAVRIDNYLGVEGICPQYRGRTVSLFVVYS